MTRNRQLIMLPQFDLASKLAQSLFAKPRPSLSIQNDAAFITVVYTSFTFFNFLFDIVTFLKLLEPGREVQGKCDDIPTCD